MFNTTEGSFFFNGDKTGGLFEKINRKWEISERVFDIMIRDGFPLGQANKIFHFHPTGTL